MRKLTMAELERPTPKQFADQAKRPIVLVLDNIRSGLNVGSIFRTADAFSIAEIILCGITPQPPHREILKTALGATETVKWSHREDTKAAVAELIDTGYAVWAVEQTDRSINLEDVSWRESQSPLALIFGNEVHGIGDDVLADLETSIEIPQSGTKHSLNVAVSAGVVIWHILYAKSSENVK